MSIVRMFVTKITGNRNIDVDIKEGVSVSSNTKVVNVKKEKAGNAEFLSVDYALEIGYEPDIGSIKIEGVMHLAGKIEDMIESKKKQITLKPEAYRDAHQAILRIPILISINIARELGLPMPISLPRVEIKD